MNETSLSQSMTAGDRADFERGAELLAHVQAGKLFDDYWVPIGKGLIAIRRTVMTVLRLKVARGGHYNDAFGRLCKKTPYENMHKVERANLLYCMEHLPDIVEMRAGWTPSERAKVNHPTSMAKRLREFINRAPQDHAPRRNVSPLALMHERNEQLIRANLDLAEQLAAAETRDGGRYDLRKDTPEHIATVWAKLITENRAEKIIAAIRRAYKKGAPAG